MEAEIPKSESAANAHKGHSLMEEHMNDWDSGTRASDSDDFVLPEAGPEMRLELSERDWDALMEDIAHPSLPNAAMLRSIERWRQHMGRESNPVDVDKD